MIKVNLLSVHYSLVLFAVVMMGRSFITPDMRTELHKHMFSQEGCVVCDVCYF